jgi:DnaJ-class molecular chaperone
VDVLGLLFFCVFLPFLRWFFWDVLIKDWREQTPPESEEDAQPTGRLDIDECYKILGCRQTASVQEIKKHYRVLVKMYHPDVVLGTKRFQKIQEDVREKYIHLGMKRFRKIQEKLRKKYIDFGTKRFREINEAYERILQDRGIEKA